MSWKRNKLLLGAQLSDALLQNDELLGCVLSGGFDYVIAGEEEGPDEKIFEWAAQKKTALLTPVSPVLRPERTEWKAWGGDALPGASSSQDFGKLAQMQQTYEAQYPDALLYTSLETPGDDTVSYRAYAETYADTMPGDILAAGVSAFAEGTVASRYFEHLNLLCEVCSDYGKDLWIRLQTECLPEEEEAMLRWQCWCSLGFGAAGLVFPLTEETAKLHDTVCGIAGEMNLLALPFLAYLHRATFATGRLGSGLLSGQLRALNRKNMQQVTTKLLSGIRDIETEEALLVGCFSKREGKGSAYVLVNMEDPRDEGADAYVRFATNGIASVCCYGADGKRELSSGDGICTLRIPSGEGVFLTVE